MWVCEAIFAGAETVGVRMPPIAVGVKPVAPGLTIVVLTASVGLQPKISNITWQVIG